MRLFDGATRHITNLNGLCVQVAGSRRVGGARLVRVKPVGSEKAQRFDDEGGKRRSACDQLLNEKGRQSR